MIPLRGCDEMWRRTVWIIAFVMVAAAGASLIMRGLEIVLHMATT